MHHKAIIRAVLMTTANYLTHAHMEDDGRGKDATYLPINLGDVALSFILEGRHFGAEMELWVEEMRLDEG